MMIMLNVAGSVDKELTSRLMVSWIDAGHVNILEKKLVKSYPITQSFTGALLMSDRKSVMLYGGQDVSRIELLNIQDGTSRKLNLKDADGSSLNAPPAWKGSSCVACRGASPEIAWIWFSGTLELYKVDLKTGQARRHLGAQDLSRVLGRKASANLFCELDNIKIAPDGSRVAFSVPGDESTSQFEPDTRRPETMVYDFRNRKAKLWGPGAPVGWIDSGTILSYRVVGQGSRVYRLSSTKVDRVPAARGCVPFAVSKGGNVASLSINPRFGKPYGQVNITDKSLRTIKSVTVPIVFVSYWVGSTICGLLD